MTNKCTKNKSHATHLGISARLTSVALTKLGHVSTVAKTLVESLNDVLQNLDATASVGSSVVHAGGVQTLAKFFYDRNDHGRGEVLLTFDIQLCLHNTLRNYARTLEIANKKVSEVVELGGYIGVPRAVTHVTQGLDVEHERIKESE